MTEEQKVFLELAIVRQLSYEQISSNIGVSGYTSYENFALEKELPRVQYWRMEKGTNFQFKSLLQILDAHEMTLEEFFKGIK